MKIKINKKYTHFAVHTATGKIVDGWEYPKSYEREDIMVFYKEDMKDNDRSLKEFKLVDALTLFKKGVNPYDNVNWINDHELNAPVVEAISIDYSNLPQSDTFVITKDYLSVNSGSTPDFATATDEQKVQIKKDGFTVHFLMYDDDDILYYGGYLKTELDGSEEAFEPLDCYGMPNAGCTDIKYKEKDGKYHSL